VTDLVTPAIVAAAVSGSVAILVAILNTWVSGAREQAARSREHFARAFAAVVAYKEFPFVVHRRDATAPARERERISAELRKVQQDIAYYAAWLSTENAAVAKAYAKLVSRLREIAGAAISDAWARSGISSDAEMNIQHDFGLAELRAQEDAYLEAVQDHLRRHRRILRWLRLNANVPIF